VGQFWPVFDLSKTVGVERRRRRGEEFGEGVSLHHLPTEGAGEGLCPLPRKIFDFFHLKIVHSGAFSYAKSKILLAVKCRERYVFLATDGDTDMKMSSFHQSRKFIPIQSVSSKSRRFDSYSRHVL